MNTTDDGYPVGEDVPVGFQLFGTEHLGAVGGLLAGADLITAKCQALDEIRHLVNTVLAKPMSGTAYGNTLRSGEQACAAEVRAILERLGLTC